jgi:hypothetical protein
MHKSHSPRRAFSLLSMSALERMALAVLVLSLLWGLVVWALKDAA